MAAPEGASAGGPDAMMLETAPTTVTTESQRLAYGNQLELILTLVSYAVGLGNLWRFPYLVYENGGGTFLVPYTIALLLLGLPIFMLELGLGQMLRQGTVNMWVRLGMPKLRGAGVAACFVTFNVAIYYLVIVAWTVFYIGALLSTVSTGVLPWADSAPGFSCPQSVLHVDVNVANVSDLITDEGLFNPTYAASFDCPASGGIPDLLTPVRENFTQFLAQPSRCPGRAAITYWNEDALQKSDSILDIGGINGYMLLSHTIVWIILWLITFKGVAVSGKLAYVTATLPYFCLICFFFGTIGLNNSSAGLAYYLTPDLSKLTEVIVWQKAATQIFFSIGIGWGSIVAFGSYGDMKNDFIGHVTKVSLINCGTSIFAGFVVFSILGFLSGEMSVVNPCFKADDISGLEGIGLQGSGLAFVAFPIAVGQMSGSFFWAFLFFIMLFTLGVGSGFGYVESITTVLFDSGIAEGMERWKVAGMVCTLCWFLGILFVTRAGDYWVKLFDSYTSVVAVFFVCITECIGITWMNPENFKKFQDKTFRLTGRPMPDVLEIVWKYVAPVYIIILFILSIGAFDLTGNATSGEEVFPTPVLYLGWFIGFIPMIAAAVTLLFDPTPLPDCPAETLSDLDAPLAKASNS